MTITATYQIDDTTGQFGGYRAAILNSIDSAVNILSTALAGNANLEITVHAIERNTSLLAAAGPTDFVYLGYSGGMYQVETLAGYQLRTGSDSNGSASDIDVYVNTTRLAEFFFDNSPWDAGDIPSNQFDFTSIMLHELLHGIAFTGDRNDATGQYYSIYRSTYDQNVSLVNGRPYFTGENARNYYGGNVPLTSGDLYHVGNGSGSGTDLYNSLMAPYADRGARDYLTSLEKAMLADMGFGTNQADILRVHPETPSQSITLRAGYGVDTAVYSGQRSNYTVTYSAASGGYTVKGNGVTDTLLSVEKLKIGSEYYWIEDLAGLTKGVHRFYNKDTGTHFLTGSNQEAYQLRQTAPNMEDEGMAFATASNTSTSLEVFRFLNKSTGSYFYTISVDERNSIQKNLSNFEYQGSSFRAYTKDSGPQEELYRFFNTATGSHFFTTSEAERDNIIGTLPTYKYEGIGFYVDVLS